MQKFLTTLFAIITVLLLCALGAGFLFLYLNSPPAIPAKESAGITLAESGVRIVVREGESAHSVGARLEEAGLIRSSLLWDAVDRIDTGFVKQGVYIVNEPTALLELRALLETGRQEMVKVTVPEGATLKRTAQIFEKSGVTESGAFLAAAEDKALLEEYHIPGGSAEGYLFPDTYHIPLFYPAERAVRLMLDTFFKNIEEIAEGGAQLNAADLHKKVILASIVEREYRVNDEAPLMAGVFYNRLDIGMRLQSCATVEYIITEIEGKPHPTRIYYSDLEIQNPYNTYLVKGLPPGPISSPGRTALAAAYHPAKTDYLYFNLADADAGRHFFSKTLSDHNNAAVLYVKAQNY